MVEWYNACGVVPADDRAVVVMYSVQGDHPITNSKEYVGVARYKKGGYILASGDTADWLVDRVAEDGESWTRDTIKINACDGAGHGLQVWEWKELKG